MRLLFFLLFCLSINTSIASTLEGIVIDAQTKESLPFAHVSVGEVINVTNLDGSFILQLPKSHNYTIKVSFIGYNTKEVSFTAEDSLLTIELEISSKMLEQVVISSNFGSELVEKSLSRVILNYDLARMKYKGYYKETLQQRDSLKYIAEGVVEIYVPIDFERDEHMPMVSPIKTRRKVFGEKEDFLPLGGHAGDMAHSTLWRQTSFLHDQNRRFYDFVYAGHHKNSNHSTYMVDFTPINARGNTKGRIYIDDVTFAIVRLDYHPISSNKHTWTDTYWEEEYIPRNGLYELFRVSFAGVKDGDQKYTADLIIYDSEAVKALPKSDYYDQAAAFYEMASDDFQDSFWENYNFLKLNIKEKEIIKNGISSE